MKLSANTLPLFLISILYIFVLSSCITEMRNVNETGLPFNVTLVEGTSIPHNESTPNGKNEPVITATLDLISIYDIATAQEAAETYFELMEAQKYSEAYQLLSPSKPHLESSEDFITRADTLYKSYKLLSIDSYLVWSATQYAADKLKKVSMVVENERCKRYIVEVKIEYKEGQMGAGPSGTYDYALTIIKDDNGWKIVQIDTIPDPYTCDKYK